MRLARESGQDELDLTHAKHRQAMGQWWEDLTRYGLTCVGPISHPYWSSFSLCPLSLGSAWSPAIVLSGSLVEERRPTTSHVKTNSADRLLLRACREPVPIG